MEAQRAWEGRTRYRQPTVADADEEDEPLLAEPSSDEDTDFADLEAEKEEQYTAISVWDELVESLLREGLISGRLYTTFARARAHGCDDCAAEDLTEEDMEHLRPFALKVNTHMSGSAFSQLPFAFPHANVSSWKTIQARIAQLSGFKPEVYDCCIASCCAFTGPHVDKQECPYCHEPRFDSRRRPRKVFIYLPLIPRLKSYLANKTMAKQMSYRGVEHEHSDGVIKDVMDSELYRTLLGKHVTVDGRQLPHKFFADSRDVALGLSTDGFAPFKRRTKTAWPLILFNYNLPPEIRFHLEHVIGFGIIPGPNKPTDFDSFLWPLVKELLRLEVGVHAYDSLTGEFFALRAFLILVFGDIPAISMVMRMKGHNGFAPCRMCNITGVRIPDTRTPYYVPLDRSRHPDVLDTQDPSVVKTFDPTHLPLRAHSEFLTQAHDVQFAATQADSDRLSKKCGVKGVPILSALSSLTFPSSFPYDFMHLIWENVVKNLMLLWSGNYKGLDEGDGSYQFPTDVWEAIGKATAASGDYIPYVFGPRPPNVASDKISWTAETRSFWTLYLAPVLLKDRFRHHKYYDHFIELVRLIHLCLQFEITDSDIQDLQDGFARWVKRYEEYVLHEGQHFHCAV